MTSVECSSADMPAKSILIADDDPALTQALAIRCRELGVEVRESPDGLHAYQSILQRPPDLLILDVNMPGAGGLSMCQVLARDARFTHIPVVVLTGQSDDATLAQCEMLGACYAWKGLDTWERIRPNIIELLHLDGASPARRPDPDAMPEPTAAQCASDDADPTLTSDADIGSGNAEARALDRACVLLIDDDADVCRALQLRLEAQGMNVIRAGSGMRGYWTAARERPDAIITDYLMPDGLGNHVIRRIRENPLTARTPLFVLSGRTQDGVGDGLQRELLELGATRCFGKPPDFDAILSALRAHIPALRNLAPPS
ncbi:MAG: Regulator of RpoS [Phycisphaerae bacterium]|nr:Regulator of RpoS [Phycisphaerae bacterium]